MASILIIEDDAETARELEMALAAAGHDPLVATDGTTGLAQVTTRPFDAITLDRMLPGIDGLDLVARLREAGDRTPVLMISALGDVDERIAGLRAGGDDYLTKPFAPAEMVARVEALLRRTGIAAETALRAGGIDMDLVRRTVQIGGQAVKLLHREFDLLAFLIRNQGRVVSRRMIFEQVWNYYFDPGANLINVHIARLRKKIDEPGAGVALATVKGEGYRLDADA